MSLLMDNYSVHGKTETIPKIKNVEVVSLPPKTAKLQPCDTSIIAAVKVHYRKRKIERALGSADEDISAYNDIHKANN